MNVRLTRIFALILAFELFISSIGIAQVSHVCKMAMEANQSAAEAFPVSEKHNCCKDELTDFCKTLIENSCCTNQVRYFHNDFNSTFHELTGLNIIKVVTLYLFNAHLFFDDEISNTTHVLLTDKFPPGEYGRDLLVSIQTFLI